jgi:hypothetical protein
MTRDASAPPLIWQWQPGVLLAMKIVEALLNRSEVRAFRELESIADDNGMRVFSKTRLSDVIQKGGTYLSQREFDYFTRCHCDYVLTDENYQPVMVVEYDGPMHTDSRQQERDRIKNALCKSAGLGILRINDRHVTKLYRGMSVLRWIVEVTELSKAFDEAQLNGQIPWDEPFDPASFDSVSGGARFPYWLSAPATQSFHGLFAILDRSASYGWHSFVGYDRDDVGCRLSWLYFDNKILWARTAVRPQDINFPHFDLLSEIDSCELGIRLAKYQKGEISATFKEEFRAIFERYCQRFDPHPSHSTGAFPFDFT